MMQSLRCCLFATAAAAICSASLVEAAPPEKVRFNEHIRPLLSGNCFYCHGPDPKHREAHLRLDTREGATADLGGYAAIVPGKPDDSTLITRVSSTDPDERMPPPVSKKPHLTADQVALLRRWIEQGAEYEDHWAFLPVQSVRPPPVKTAAWPSNGIDSFILAPLAREGIKPSPAADPATLIRRVSLDMTGLLPSPEEVDEFIRAFEKEGERERAYQALVDRLLSSPHFGERWGRHWLDQARYADSNGYSIDSERQMWPYRDWVIKALNDDMPFDRFTVEQLAGDLLPNATKNQLVATAFHRNTLINEEGGTDKEQFRHEAVVDRVNTTGAVWLGLTIGCCQCHTHKFDPIEHREYYGLFAFFNNGTDINNKGATIPVARGEVFGQPLTPPQPTAPTPEQFAAWEKQELARLEKLNQQQDAAEAAWLPVQYVEYGTESNAGFELLDDNSLLSDGRGSDNDTYRIVAKTDLKQLAAIRLRALTHPSLPRTGPGRAGNGNFVLTDFDVTVAGMDVAFGSAFADHEQPSFAASAAVDDDPKSGWAINVGYGQTAKLNANHEAVFVLDKPLSLANGQTLEIKLAHNANADYLIGRFALDLTEKSPAKRVAVDEKLLAVLRVGSEQRTPEQKKTVSEAFARAEAIQAGRGRRGAGAGDSAEVMVWKELDEPRKTYIALRGDFLRPDKETGVLVPDVPAAVTPKLAESSDRNRLDLARWLVNPENPLTPRVQMNRVWMRLFGRGLVETEEDFGTQGTLPTHPELLDWLAGEWIRRGWSLKDMLRLIVTSNTYRQASHFRDDLKEKDPRNLLLARQDRTRLDAEIVRDAALSASGLLTRTIGGPSIKPPQPDGVYAFTQTAKRWTADSGAGRYRRALYTLFFRSAPHPLFTTFDAPDFQTVCTRRGRSNTPLQALNVANDETFLEFAQGLAARVMWEVSDANPDARIRRAFLLALCREPSAAELIALRGYYDRQYVDLQDHVERAKELFQAESVTPDAAAAASLTLVCRAILNTDSFITRE